METIPTSERNGCQLEKYQEKKMTKLKTTSLFDFYSVLVDSQHVIETRHPTIGSIVRFNKLYSIVHEWFKTTNNTVIFRPEMVNVVFWHESNLAIFPVFETENDLELISAQDKLIKSINSANAVFSYSANVVNYLRSINFKYIMIESIDMEKYEITYEVIENE